MPLKVKVVRQKVDDAGTPGSWYISGVGEIDGVLGLRGHVPQPDHDERLVKEEELPAGQDPPAVPPPDNVVAYQSRYVDLLHISIR